MLLAAFMLGERGTGTERKAKHEKPEGLNEGVHPYFSHSVLIVRCYSIR
ncbi:MAG TPA: hypothetical protein VFL97_05625 [Nitrococcus sp.]|nr:hypothetical protein [Nitrococcus sp.]